MSASWPTPVPGRSPWQRFYGAILRQRRRRARTRAKRLPGPTISVGNLHWGGGGKTPLVAALAEHLRDRGRRVGVLSRGYRRTTRGPRLVSLGAAPLSSWQEAGDEPYWLARELPGVAVAVAARRIDAGRLLMARTEIDVFLLDDGFSHVGLARDVELLAFPELDPFSGGRLLPSGRLREPLGAVSGADLVVLTGLAEGGRGLGDALARSLAPYGFSGPGFECVLEAELRAPAAGSPPPAGARMVLVTGTARPRSVAETAARLGVEIAEHLTFADHHAYPESSVDRIRAAARRHGAAVLTTGKDLIKLEGRLDLPIVEIEVRARPEAGLLDWLDRRLLELAPTNRG